MGIGVYWGCMILTSQYAYEMSLRAILPKFNTSIIDVDGVSCCGAPIKNVNQNAAIYLAIRNLALAEKAGISELLVPCNGCYLSFSEALYYWKKDDTLRRELNNLLAEEGLEFNDNINLWHTIDFLHDKVSVEKIKAAVKKPLNGLKFVSHPGCHILRPSTIVNVDNPEKPRKLDNLLEALGAESIDYPEKLDCCGGGLLLSHPESALTIAGLKLKAIKNLNVDGLVVSCPSCKIMLGAKQEAAGTIVGEKFQIPVFYYTQLLGLALGIEEKSLGLHLNQSPVDKIIEKLT